MISHSQTPRRAQTRRPILLLLVAGLLLSLLSFATESGAAAQDCPEGSVLSENGVTCELDVSDNNSICPEGQQLDEAGLLCEPIPVENPDSICPPGQQLDEAGLLCEAIDTSTEGGICDAGEELDEAGLLCVPIEVDPDAEPSDDTPVKVCDEGYSLGRDGVTCIADGPECDRDEIVNDDGECVRTFKCPDGLILASDLLSCISDKCPDGELLSVDGRRCVAPDTDCPDGSPRPKGGACLVVETVTGADGEVDVVVRCAEADSFCQARVKQCSNERAEGATELGEQCADPRGSCDEDDHACAESNDRLVECATRDLEEGEDGEPVSIGGADDPCADLCPRLHRLDPSGECIEFLDPRHPCVIAGQVPDGVETNAVLDGYSYLAGTGQCVTRVEFLRRLGNFEASQHGHAVMAKRLAGALLLSAAVVTVFL